MFTDYIRLAYRNLVKSGGYSLINVFGFAIGLASTLLIVLWASHELSYENFFSKNDRICQVLIRQRESESQPNSYIPYVIAPLLEEHFPEVEAITRLENFSHFETMILEYRSDSAGAEPRYFYEYGFNLADSAFFSIFDYTFRYGNAGQAFPERQSIVLSEETAERIFGREDPVGRELLVNGEKAYTVSGVVHIPSNTELRFGTMVINRTVRSEERLSGTDSNGPSYVLLREGVDREALQAKVLTFLDNLELPLEKETDVLLVPVRKMHTYYGQNALVFILLSVGVMILVIACLNYVNLSTALLASRRKTIALFKLAGARRKSVFILTLFESNLVVLLSLVLAFLLLWMALPWFDGITDLPLSAYAPGFLKRQLPWMVLLLLLTGTLSGLIPGIRFAVVESTELLHVHPVTAGRRRNWPRLLMVIFQFLVSITLITTTALIFQQRKYITGLPMGFDGESIIQVPVNNALLERYTDYSQELEKIPGVRAVSAASTLPATIGNHSRVSWGPGPEEVMNNMKFAMVMPGYFKTFDMQMERGTVFDESRPASLDGYIVNQSAVRAMGLENPVGHPVSFWGKEGEIVGVVKDFQNNWLYNPLMPLILSTQEGHRFFIKYLYVKLDEGVHPPVIRKISQVTKDFAPEIPFDYTYVTDEIYDINRQGIRFNQIFLSFSVISVFIAILGLLGMSLYSSARRTKEIGIRKAHGARPGDIIRILLGELYTGVGIAMVLAVPLVWLMSNSWLRYFANRTTVAWWIFLLGGLAAALCALLSVGLQTVRAARRNPVTALRYE